MINVLDIENSELEYKNEVLESLAEAKEYLISQNWCTAINKGWVASSFGYILNIFYFKIIPDHISCNDEFVWIIEGDIPPAYIDIISATNAYEALNCYINLMEEWVENVKNEDSADECFPLSIPPQRKYAIMLESRLKLLKEDYLPIIKEDTFNLNK